MNLLNKIKCFFLNHQIDWDEYEIRCEKEQHLMAANIIFCKRCNKYVYKYEL